MKYAARIKYLLRKCDSIRMDYDKAVKTLEGRANVYFPSEAHSDAVHFYTPMGTEAFTNEVLSFILPLLDITEKIAYKEELYTDKSIGI